MDSETIVIGLKKIEISGGTQPRTEINEQVVSDYAESMKNGAAFPPVILFHDGKKYWLGDGFHRYHANAKAGFDAVQATVKRGTLRDAKLYSLGSNADHGLQRTREDKKQAVISLLKDKEWSSWSDRKVAKHCAVSHTFVASIRESLAPKPAPQGGNVATLAPRTDGNVASFNSANDSRPAPYPTRNTPQDDGPVTVTLPIQKKENTEVDHCLILCDAVLKNFVPRLQEHAIRVEEAMGDQRGKFSRDTISRLAKALHIEFTFAKNTLKGMED